MLILNLNKTLPLFVIVLAIPRLASSELPLVLKLPFHIDGLAASSGIRYRKEFVQNECDHFYKYFVSVGVTLIWYHKIYYSFGM